MGHDEMRIVSLLPSGTETVAALGLADNLVGRSHECDYPPDVSVLPVCTSSRIDTTGTSRDIDTAVRETMANALSLFEVDTTQLAALRPTHIITQDQCAACAISLKDVEAAISGMINTDVQIISLEAARIGDVWAGIRRLGRELGVDAEDLSRRITRRIAKIAMRSGALGHDDDAPRVAMIEWIEPVMVAGNWVPELVSIAGGESVLAELGEPSHEIALEALSDADPDIIIFAPCGFALPRAAGEAREVVDSEQWKSLRAVRTGRCFAADGNAHFNRPGPRLIESVEILTEILHPGDFDFGHQGIAWRQL